jgi:cytochrome o ubiquinol oxidase subunit 1
LQILQFIVSIVHRKNLRDQSGDPWNGRTLEWATSSPAPVYNFAVIPNASKRDAFWAAKQSKVAKISSEEYEDIHLPKNTPLALVIAAFAFIFGFAIIWHIWWLAALGFIGVITTIVIRSTDEDPEYTIKAAEIKKMEAAKA